MDDLIDQIKRGGIQLKQTGGGFLRKKKPNAGVGPLIGPREPNIPPSNAVQEMKSILATMKRSRSGRLRPSTVSEESKALSKRLESNNTSKSTEGEEEPNEDLRKPQEKDQDEKDLHKETSLHLKSDDNPTQTHSNNTDFVTSRMSAITDSADNLEEVKNDNTVVTRCKVNEEDAYTETSGKDSPSFEKTIQEKESICEPSDNISNESYGTEFTDKKISSTTIFLSSPEKLKETS